MATFSLDDIPTAILALVISYLDDPRAICSLQQTSTRYRDIIRESRCWEELYRKRWKLSSVDHPEDFKKEYQRRHQLDVTIQGCVDTLMIETTERDEVVRCVTNIMAHGRDSMDLSYKSYLLHLRSIQVEGRTADGPPTNREELIGICLLRSVHCSIVFQDIMDLSLREGNHPSLLEDFAIASSSMFFEVKMGPEMNTAAWIRRRLDEMACTVKERFPKEEMSVEEKLDVLNAVFFDELNFTGNTDNYYDFNNSMLHKALERRTGIPMTLAILYKCIARRVGLQVDIIGLPGHIVIGVPALSRYVDVFRKGRRLLTAADCERIVNSYGHPMIPEFLLPKSPADVFRRILNNCGACLAQTFPPNASKRMAIEAMRAVLINPSKEQVEDCRRWFCQILWGAHSSAILQEMSTW